MSELEKTEDVKSRFLHDTKDHTLEILHDDGVYRHLKCTNKGSSVYRFDVTTWPGYLCLSGDMGTFVFARVNDMLRFFRPGDYAWERDPEHGLVINLGYWAEKLQTPKRGDGKTVTEFSQALFRDAVESYVVDHIESNEPAEDVEEDERRQWEESIEELRTQLEDEVFSVTEEWGGDEAHTMAVQAAQSFGELDMNEIYEHNMRDYTYHFQWICYAIVWAVIEYDKAVAK